MSHSEEASSKWEALHAQEPVVMANAERSLREEYFSYSEKQRESRNHEATTGKNGERKNEYKCD